MADADFHSKYTGEQIEEILDGAVLDNRYKQASAVQRARARTNIGATADEMQVVSFALSQELTKDQKAIARKNIGAGSSDIGLVIKGYVNTVDELQEIVGKDGEAYGVGSAYPYDIYIWDSYRDIWVNNGNIRGADGKDGKDGSDASVTAENIEIALGFKPLPVSNPNLLDNPWFTINQRGKTSYTPTSGNYYTFDRWCMENNDPNVSVTKNSDGTITWKNNGTATNRQFKQIFEVPIAVGETITASIDVTAVSGEVRMYYALAVTPYTSFIHRQVTTTGIITSTGTVTASGATKFFITLDGNASVTFRAVKLEHGSVSTLANDHAPDPAFELRKCQKYQFLMPFGSASAPVATGISWTAETIRVFMPTPVNMRVASPSVEYLLGSLTNIRLKGAERNLTPSAVSCSITNGGVIMAFTVSGAVVNNVYSAVASSNEIKALINVNL